MQRLRSYILVACALILLHLSGLPVALTNDLLSLRFALAERPATGEVAIVAIDAPSLASAGVWPWPRSLHAQLIDRLRAVGASNIVFDVDFSSTSTSEHDRTFEVALMQAGGSVALPTFKQFAVTDGKRRLFTSRPLPRFAAQAWSAAVNIQPDPDGIVRRYGVGQSMPDGMTASLAAFVAGSDAIDERTFLIDFGIAAKSIPVISFIDVLANSELSSRLQGKKVIVGATAVELGDRVTVPGGHVLPGVTLQALAAESLLQGRDLRIISPWLANLAAVLTALLIGFAFSRWTAARVAILIACVAVGAEILALVVQSTSPFIIDTAPLLLTALVWAVVLACEEIVSRGLLRRIAERRFHRVAMSIADGLICTDADGRITMWNPAAVAMFGYLPEDIGGRPIAMVLVSLRGESWSPPPFAGASANGHVQELQGIRRDGSRFLVEASLSAWEAGGGLHHSVAVRDISVRKREEERIRYLAEYDALTGLFNRSSLIDMLTTRMNAVGDGGEVALLLLDLDRFKEINDTLGHAGGDHVLRQAAARIKSLAGNDAIVARLGGDEFAVVIGGPSLSQRARQTSDAIVDSFKRDAIVVAGSAQHVAVSIGIAIAPLHNDSPDGLMVDADLAMYRAKGESGGSFALFEPIMRKAFEERVVLAEELQLAFARGEFELHFQPQINLQSNAIVGAEALIRWNHPERGMVSPGLFIPLLNTLPISNDVSLWTMRAACRQARAWQLQGRDIRVGVNLAPPQLRTMDLPAATELVLAETQLPARLLELEVTEDIIIEDDAKAHDVFRRIRAIGVHLAWDDFGTGFGSLTYLKKFSLDRLKIDQSFVRKLQDGTQDHAIVDYTIKLSKSLGLAVIAEGVESAEIAELLTRMGCDESQGYYFSRPLPASEFEARYVDKSYRAA